TIAGPPADKKTVTHAIGPFCYLSIRFGQLPFLSLRRGERWLGEAETEWGSHVAIAANGQRKGTISSIA
ncbi:hypothetical protein NKI46_30620, partial [Mesorhizobium sp. M0615]|uniref:hypothetical protein n=1 Tax=unclassified Mesorhizobium TaxID=325217 RepID=UPI003337547E